MPDKRDLMRASGFAASGGIVGVPVHFRTARFISAGPACRVDLSAVHLAVRLAQSRM